MDELSIYQGTHSGGEIDRDLDFVDVAFNQVVRPVGRNIDAVIPTVEYEGTDVDLYYISSDSIADREVPDPNEIATRNVLVNAYNSNKSLALHKCIKVSLSNVSSLPATFHEFAVMGDPIITSDLVVVNCFLSNPSAQMGNWTIETGLRSVTVSGAISRTTDITIFLADPTIPDGY